MYYTNLPTGLCSHWGDIRQQQQQQKACIILTYPQDYVHIEVILDNNNNNKKHVLY